MTGKRREMGTRNPEIMEQGPLTVRDFGVLTGIVVKLGGTFCWALGP